MPVKYQQHGCRTRLVQGQHHLAHKYGWEKFHAGRLLHEELGQSPVLKEEEPVFPVLTQLVGGQHQTCVHKKNTK